MTERIPEDRATRADRLRKERRDLVLLAAVILSRRVGFGSITRDGVAAQAGIAAGNVNHAFGTIAALRNAVMEYAVLTEDAALVAQGIACAHPAVQHAPPELRAAALAAVTA